MSIYMGNFLPSRANVIGAAVGNLFHVSNSHLIEALSAAYGFKSHAAFLASKEPVEDDTFNRAAFIARLSTLTDPLTACSVGVLLDGVTLKIDIQKRQFQPVREVWYDVRVELSGYERPVHGDLVFVLPERDAGSAEPFRIDSTSDHRSQQVEPIVRSAHDGRLLTAQLVDGVWNGGMYVYAVEHQRDDRNSVGWVRAGLARAILSALAPVRCDVYRPETYEHGCWRVRLVASPQVLSFWNDSSVTFDVPNIPYHRFHLENGGYLADIRAGGPQVGRFVDGVWLSDLYPNGQRGLDNLRSARQVQSEIVKSMHAMLTIQGYFSGKQAKAVAA